MFAAEASSRVKICHEMYMRYRYIHMDQGLIIWLDTDIR